MTVPASGVSIRWACRIVAALALVVAVTASDRATLVGQKAPVWTGMKWLDGRPRELADLGGRVVLVRWWTAPHCPYCGATAPALNEFHRTYAERGLTVLGIYHHKSAEPLDDDAVSAHARRFRFEFPVAIDPEWQNLRRWWLDRGGDNWTSVSFLLDRKGVVRHIHPGGQYVKGDAAYAALKAKIEELLAEK